VQASSYNNNQASFASGPGTVVPTRQSTQCYVDPQTPQEHEVVRLRKSEIVKVTEELLTAIAESDWDSYQKRCDPALSCFEPESIGNLVTGMSFHRFYFDHAPHGLSKQQCQRGSIHTSILNPHVILLGETSAVIAYIRMTQYVDSNGASNSKQCEESRVWQHQDDNQWRCVHFHRSAMK
jgi:calcium/calmodulin-dependent protein kinase (CaM kinase) II